MSTLLIVAITLCSLALVAIVFLNLSTSPCRKGAVQIVVLGDIGRSPRMQYHALSIVQHGGHVDFIGFLETEPLRELKQNTNVVFHTLPSSPRVFQTSNKFAFLLVAPLKVLFQIWTLWRALAYQTPVSEWMLVQTPPSVPTLLVAILVCRFRQTKLVIDWHNFGYSVLALKLGNAHPLVRISAMYERLLSKFADAHFAVTDAMCHALDWDFDLNRPVLALHDRPAPLFVPLSNIERDAWLTQHELTAAESADIIREKTRLIVSATSWTSDEDFSVLLEALCSYSASAISDSPHLPELLVIITGKGPLKEHYLNKISDLDRKQELEMVEIKTAWLSFEDYAQLLGAADLGVSLHTSSSGVDLPMKVVDMFGAGLPVLGYNNFKAWPELVKEDINGKGFSDAQQMADNLKTLFDPASNALDTLRDGAKIESTRRWQSEWDPIAGRLFGFTT